MPKKSLPHNFKDLTGQRFGRLVVIERAPSLDWRTYWRCQCDCGNQIIVAARHLASGKTLSCKCLQSENRTRHGLTTHTKKSREYAAWIDAKARCFNPNHIGYKNWGGRGITMAPIWQHDPARFIQDMGPCPEGFELDRIDNDGNYEPGNCRWASHTENNRHKRDTVFLTYAGKTKSLAQWAEEVGLSHSTLWARLYVWHWPIEKALFARGKRKLSR